MKGRDIVVTHKKLLNMTKLFSNQDNLAHYTQIISFLNFFINSTYIYMFTCRDYCYFSLGFWPVGQKPFRGIKE